MLNTVMAFTIIKIIKMLILIKYFYFHNNHKLFNFSIDLLLVIITFFQ